MTNPDAPNRRDEVRAPEFMRTWDFRDLTPGKLMYASPDSFKILEGRDPRIIVDTIEAIYAQPLRGTYVPVTQVFEWVSEELVDGIVADFTRIPHLHTRSLKEANARAEERSTKGVAAAMFAGPDGKHQYVGPGEFLRCAIWLVSISQNAELKATPTVSPRRKSLMTYIMGEE